MVGLPSAVAKIEEEKKEAQLERKRLQENFEQHEQLERKQQEDIRKASGAASLFHACTLLRTS